VPKVKIFWKKTKWKTPKVDKNKTKELQAWQKEKCPKFTKQNCEDVMK
jgi:hypothetical protein